MTRLSSTGGVPREQAQATLHIDLDALAANWRVLAAMATPAQCSAVVKADAYGIGIEPAVRALHNAGCRTFFVAHPSEALRVRATLGADALIFTLNGVVDDARTLALLAANDIVPVIVTREQAARWRSAHPGHGFALQIDTGMNRLGIDPHTAQEIASGGDVRLLMSHFVSSELADDPLNDLQIERFTAATTGLPGIARSMANSSAIFLPQKPFFDLVRPGYALYGGNPRPDRPNPMRPIARLVAPILQLRTIEAGETVGYNAQWTAQRRTRLATIGIGYADGIPRNAMATETKTGGEAIVCGVRCPFAGRVSMDLITIDVTDVQDTSLAEGSPVELLGETITIDDLAARSNTIGYEILTSLGRRYHRIYTGAGAPTAS